jgi:hypothetical protein
MLGFYCRHKYAHSTSDASDRLPFAFKGVDLIVYSIFWALGLHVKAHPILDLDYDNWEVCVGSDFHDLITLSRFRGELLPEHVKSFWDSNWVEGIVWMNDPRSSERAWMYGAVSPNNLPSPSLPTRPKVPAILTGYLRASSTAMNLRSNVITPAPLSSSSSPAAPWELKNRTQNYKNKNKSEKLSQDKGDNDNSV